MNLARPESLVEWPIRCFAVHAAVHAEAGATATVVVEVLADVLRHWSQAEGSWRTEPRTYQAMVGRSADLEWSGGP
ncbi:fibronectin type III-like domain-contianing protein [Streptomyces sp. NPDC059999]|uniref:fibronectin type III-like domain-contianing protein n=1 Tax=Streptomyces sp. NPDC059999 TaxID=3347030 RepID=UPI003682C39C